MDPRQLREATRAEHEATEALMPLGGHDFSREMYVRVLQALEPLVRGWERWAEAAAPESVRPMLLRRKRSQLLAADLRTMNASGEQEPAMPVAWDAVVGEGMERGSGGVSPEVFEAAFLGALYVMEGSTLGGRFLARHVEEVLGMEPGRGDSYFVGHGEATGAMWREVTARISAVPEEMSVVVIEAARRTFRAFGEGLRAGLRPTEAAKR